MIKCLGCGITLQCDNPLSDGYTKNLDNKFCERCFKIKNYNEFNLSNKGNDEFLKKIDYINKTGDLVILTAHFLDVIDFNILNINNPIILVFTKRDLLPRSVFEEKFLNNVKCNLNVKCKLFVSSKNNYHLDELFSIINKFKVSSNVYLIGLTNSGKSTLINKFLKNYSSYDDTITTSNFPSTTLDFLKKKVNDDLYLIDTPGLLDDGNIIFKADSDLIKKIVPNKEINPIIYQIKCFQSIIVEDFLRIDLDVNNIIIYMSNKLKISRIYKKNDKFADLNCYKVLINDNQDLVIKGLGFIKFKYKCMIDLYLWDDVKFFVRDSLV